MNEYIELPNSEIYKLKSVSSCYDFVESLSVKNLLYELFRKNDTFRSRDLEDPSDLTIFNNISLIYIYACIIVTLNIYSPHILNENHLYKNINIDDFKTNNDIDHIIFFCLKEPKYYLIEILFCYKVLTLDNNNNINTDKKSIGLKIDIDDASIIYEHLIHINKVDLEFLCTIVLIYQDFVKVLS